MQIVLRIHFFLQFHSDAIDLQKEPTLLNKHLSADLTEVNERLTSIERIRKEVE